VVGNEPEVARNFTWAGLVMEDGNFRIQDVSVDGTPTFQYIHQLFLAIIHVASQLLLCLFWISLRLGIGVYNQAINLTP
jgi:hypothetical protein